MVKISEWTVRFLVNETFREKMRKFSVAFPKLFHKISYFFAKNKWSKNEAKFLENEKNENFAKRKVKNHEFQ